MALRGVWQLKKLVVAYCDFSGSSRGTRFFLSLPSLSLSVYIYRISFFLDLFLCVLPRSDITYVHLWPILVCSVEEKFCILLDGSIVRLRRWESIHCMLIWTQIYDFTWWSYWISLKNHTTGFFILWEDSLLYSIEDMDCWSNILLPSFVSMLIMEILQSSAWNRKVKYPKF